MSANQPRKTSSREYVKDLRRCFDDIGRGKEGAGFEIRFGGSSQNQRARELLELLDRYISNGPRLTRTSQKAMDLMNSKNRTLRNGESKESSSLKANEGSQSRGTRGTPMALMSQNIGCCERDRKTWA
jgi:hypothetical protein